MGSVEATSGSCHLDRGKHIPLVVMAGADIAAKPALSGYRRLQKAHHNKKSDRDFTHAKNNLNVSLQRVLFFIKLVFHHVTLLSRES